MFGAGGGGQAAYLQYKSTADTTETEKDTVYSYVSTKEAKNIAAGLGKDPELCASPTGHPRSSSLPPRPLAAAPPHRLSQPPRCNCSYAKVATKKISGKSHYQYDELMSALFPLVAHFSAGDPCPENADSLHDWSESVAEHYIHKHLHDDEQAAAEEAEP